MRRRWLHLTSVMGFQCSLSKRSDFRKSACVWTNDSGGAASRIAKPGRLTNFVPRFPATSSNSPRRSLPSWATSDEPKRVFLREANPRNHQPAASSQQPAEQE